MHADESFRWCGYNEKPTIPPASVNARSTSSDLFRSAGCHQDGLAWVMAMGRSEISMASRVDCSAEWLMSTTRPTRFISAITSRPIRVTPESVSS